VVEITRECDTLKQIELKDTSTTEQEEDKAQRMFDAYKNHNSVPLCHSSKITETFLRAYNKF